MGKRKASEGKDSPQASQLQSSNEPSSLFTTSQSNFDSALASLFSTSSGPVKTPPLKRRKLNVDPSPGASSAASDENDDDSAAAERLKDSLFSEEEGENVDVHEDEAGNWSDRSSSGSESAQQAVIERKRKRKHADDDLEATYLRKLAREEAEEEQKLSAEREPRRQSFEQDKPPSNAQETEDVAEPNEISTHSPPPQHETVNNSTSKTETELDKAARTVFLANVSITAITSSSAKKELIAHLSLHLPALPPSKPSHKIESFRFRSTAYASPLPKKASFTQGELKESTSHSTNAYCVYNTKMAAREAARRLNGTIALGRHLRVDEVAHPMKIDHRRCVFVGNLGFVDDETEMKAALADSEHPEDKKKSQSKALKSDVEEGLWVQCAKAGAVESVRVVRDSQTRIGKGFAYVQFNDENAVERALLFNDKKFPPMLPRKLRVTRCRKPSQTALALEKNKQRMREVEKSEKLDKRSKKRSRDEAHTAKPDESALQGRLRKMLGKAGVAEMRAAAKGQKGKPKPAVNTVLKPEPEVFEGHRATSSEGTRGLKLGGVKRKKGRGQVKKRSERDIKRATAYKQKGKVK